MSPDTLRNSFLRGMDMADEHGRPLPDSALDLKIGAAVAAFQRRYGVRLTPHVVRMGELELPGPRLAPELPRYHADAMPYDPRDFEGSRYVSLKLPIGPAKGTPRVFLCLPGGRPYEWQPDWVQLQRRARTVQIFPMGNTASVMPMALTGMALSAVASGRTIPNGWQVEYQAGYTAEDLAGDHADVLQALGMLAAISVLIPGSLDRFASRGIAGLSASVDGLSNSTNLAGGGQSLRYAPFIEAYRQELTEWEKTYQERGIGLRFGVL